MKSYTQVAVIGGGVVGCSVLYHLTKAGWRDVVLIERHELTSGSTWHAAGGMHTINGGLMLAGTPERMDWLRLVHSRGRYLGMQTEFVDMDEAARLFPLLDKRYFVGALYDPIEGHVDPSGVTHAFAKAARLNGAEVYRFTRVIDLQPAPDGGWMVITDKGTLHAE